MTKSPISILQRYILKECLGFFVLSLLIFTSLLLTLKILKLASLVIHKGVQVSEIFKVIISIIPTFFEIAIPLATLLGCMLAMTRLSSDSEIVVIRSSGISFYKLLVAPIVTGILLSVLCLYVSTTLKPWGYNLLGNTLFEIARSKSTSALESGLFQKIGSLTFYCKSLDGDTGAATSLLIDDKRDANIRKLITAKTGRITTDPRTRNISLRLFDGEIHEIVEGKYIKTLFESNSVILQSGELFGADSLSSGRSPRELSMEEIDFSLNELRKLIDLKNESPELGPKTLDEVPEILKPQMLNQLLTKDSFIKRMVRILEEYYLRFSVPFSTLLFALIGAIFGIQPARIQKSSGMAVSILSVILIFVIYYTLLSSGITLAESKTLSAITAIWMPNIFLMVLISVLIYFLGKEKWNSVAEGIIEIFPTRLFKRRRKTA